MSKEEIIKIPVDELGLVSSLNDILEAAKTDRDYLNLALKTLREVKDTFSLYDVYMEKVGMMIK